jgi:hypothetical protein
MLDKLAVFAPKQSRMLWDFMPRGDANLLLKPTQMGQGKKPGVPSANLGASTSSSGHHVVDLIITESLETPWRYHWSAISEQTSALCGANTMPANLACENWGAEYSGVRVTWCAECHAMKRQIIPDADSPPRGGPTLPDD